jgi:Arc/MetJ family transcription regulator
MQGHLRKRGERWAFVIELERDPITGKRRQKWVSGFPTRDAAQKALREKLTAVDRDEDPFPPETTVRPFVLERWLPHLETQQRVRPRTIASYRQLWTDHAFPVIGGMELRKVRVAHVQSVLDAMTEAGKAARTVAHARAAMSAAFRQAVRWQLVRNNVVRDAEAPRKQPPDLRVPTGAELRAIVEAARGTPFEIAVLLAATTGARRGVNAHRKRQHL